MGNQAPIVNARKAVTMLPNLSRTLINPNFNLEKEGEIDKLQNNWMAYIPDEQWIDEIAIPGTHNTMAYALGLPHVKNQSMDLCKQLLAGIRFLDFHLRHINNKLWCYNGQFSLGFCLDDILEVCRNFLEAYPSEVLFIKITDDQVDGENTKPFAQTFWADYWNPEYCALIRSPVKLKEVRGKVVILKDFEDLADGFGIKWSDVLVQDLSKYESFEEKQIAIRAHSKNTQMRSGHQLPVSFFSASTWWKTPQEISQEVNEIVFQIKNPKCGIIAFDFPSMRHILYTLNLNNQTIVEYAKLGSMETADTKETREMKDQMEMFGRQDSEKI